MVKRFSSPAFITATVIHLVVTLVFVSASIQVERDSMLSGVYRNPLWLTVSAWIWAPLPMLISHIFPSLIIYHLFFLLGWSVCVGVLFGLLAPRFLRWRRQTI